MHEHENPAEASGSGASREENPWAQNPRADGSRPHRDDERIAVEVVRTGGLAGLKRRWQVEPAPDDAPQWVAMVDRCPWDEPFSDGDAGADRYVWSIHATLPDTQRERDVPDALLQGAWRELVDAVRDAADSAHNP